jgi:outer membrane protein TolC
VRAEIFALCLTFAAGLPAAAKEGEVEAPAPAEMERLDLDGFVELALKNGVALGQANAQLEYSRARQDFARAQAMPRITVEAGIGPTPGVTGNALRSATDWGDWGYAARAKVDVLQPLYTFGALTKGREAAAAATQGETLVVERERWKLRAELARYYYGYQLAFEMIEVAEDAEQELRNALQKTRKATEIDQLNGFVYEAQIRASEAQKGQEQARLGMAWKTGVYGKSVPRWRRANLKRPERVLGALESYLEVARTSRPELRALRAEADARRLYADAEAARLLPVIGIVGQYSYAHSNVREDQQSVFASDPHNGQQAFIGLGLRWDLFSAEQNAKVSMLRAEALKAEAQQTLLAPGAIAEVEKVYLDLQHATKTAGLRQEAEKAARRVLLDRFGAYQLGNLKARELLEALATSVLARKATFEAIFEENLAWAQFESALGKTL